MRNNRTPGTDGYPAEFFRVFYNELAPLLYRVYQEAIQLGRFHISARRGIISLMEKLREIHCY